MQWLIDIIAARVSATMGYRDRGNCGGPDHHLATLVRDNAWHDLDLSAIVPDGANCIAFNLRLRAAVTGKTFRLRNKAVTTEEPRAMTSVYPAGLNCWFDMFIGCNADRVIQYRMSTDPWLNVELTVKGWWLGPQS